MGILVVRSQIFEKVNHMNGELALATEGSRKTLVAMGRVCASTGSFLQGQAWSQVRCYIEEVQYPLTELYLHWLRAQTEANRKYSREAAVLPMNRMDEENIKGIIRRYRSAQKRERAKRNPSAAKIAYYARMIRIYEGFLERLYTFVRRTEHVYENAWSLLRLLKQADTSLSQVSLQEDLGGLHYAVMDREWLVEIRNQNAACREQEKKWDEVEEKAYWTEERIERFWLEAESYEDLWWQDEEKLEQAYKALRYEAELKGGIDVRAEGIYQEGAKPHQKIYALQAIFSAMRSGFYDEELLRQMEIVLADNGKDIHEMNQMLDAGALDIGWQEYHEILGKESGDFLERYPELRDAPYEIARAIIMARQGNGPEGKGSIKEFLKENIAKEGEDEAATIATEQVLSEGGTNSIPDKASDIANQIKAKNGAVPQGYKGGRTYKNIPLEEGAQKLPKGINYKEYDINPYIKGQNRGTERIVIGDDGSVWYTNDHYFTFTKIE